MFVPVHDDDVALVHFADGLDAAQVKGIEAGDLAWKLGVRLIENFIRQHRRLVAIAAGDFAPQCSDPLLVVGVVPEIDFAVRALGVPVGGLAAGGAVEIEQHPEALAPAPADDAVQAAEALFAPLARVRVGLEMAVAERQPHMVEAHRADASHVGLGQIVVHVGVPEGCGLLGAEHLGEGLAHHVVHLRQADHEVFDQHPVAKADAAQRIGLPPATRSRPWIFIHCGAALWVGCRARTWLMPRLCGRKQNRAEQEAREDRCGRLPGRRPEARSTGSLS